MITGPVLSRLYGSEIEVVRLHGRIFVMSGSHDLEHDEHRHDDGMRMPTGMPMGTGMGMGTHTTGTAMRGRMLEYDFMRNAFAAAAVVALVAGIVGYFLVLRGQTFAGHALAHVGFTGATGAVLMGLAPLWGMVPMTVAAGIGMGMLGERLAQRDVAVGLVLALSLGFGLLFLHFYTASPRRRPRCCSATCWRWMQARYGCCWGSAC